MGFSFNSTAGASQSSIKPRLEGNKIHRVTFDGCEIQDIQGKKDPGATYKVIKLKFSNASGAFEHTVFEPKDSDFARSSNEFVDKDGKTNKIPQASNVENMMLLFKHAIDAINPVIGKEIDNGVKKLEAPNWDALRRLVAKILDPFKGCETNIKLVTNKKGEAIFPGFFSSVNREGTAYIRNNFIGETVAFTSYEASKIKKATEAKPTDMSTVSEDSSDLPDTSTSSSDGFEEFSIGDL